MLDPLLQPESDPCRDLLPAAKDHETELFAGHVLVFSEIQDGIRIISFRKANQREGEKHGFALTRD